jgi:hypothetical protein
MTSQDEGAPIVRTSQIRWAIALSCAIALAVAGCLAPAATPRTEPTPFPTNATVRLADAIASTLAQRTVRFEFGGIVTGSSQIRYGTRFSAIGTSTLGEPHQMEMTADFADLGLGTVTAIEDGDRMYLTGGFLDSILKPGRWVLIDPDTRDSEAQQIVEATGRASDVAVVLYYLYGESGLVALRPPQQLRGLPADRLVLTIDLERAADTVPDAVRQSVRGDIDALLEAGMKRTLEGEVWIQQGLIRRVILTYSFEVLKGGGTLRVTYDFVDFGDPVSLELPDSDLVVPLEDLLDRL